MRAKRDAHALWRLLRMAATRDELRQLAGEPSASEPEDRPGENWTERWTYTCPAGAGPIGFSVRLDEDTVYAVDTIWEQRPAGTASADLSALIEPGDLEGELLRKMGLPTSVFRGDSFVSWTEAWYYGRVGAGAYVRLVHGVVLDCVDRFQEL